MYGLTLPKRDFSGFMYTVYKTVRLVYTAIIAKCNLLFKKQLSFYVVIGLISRADSHSVMHSVGNGKCDAQTQNRMRHAE